MKSKKELCNKQGRKGEDKMCAEWFKLELSEWGGGRGWKK
jgi:hypothetical protein